MFEDDMTRLSAQHVPVSSELRGSAGESEERREFTVSSVSCSLVFVVISFCQINDINKI